VIVPVVENWFCLLLRKSLQKVIAAGRNTFLR